MRWLSYRVAWLFIIFLLSQLAMAQRSGPHVIKGTVYVPSGGPAPRTEVMLVNRTGTQIDRIFTDQDGRYAFSGVGLGSYRVVVPGFGTDYAQASEEVELSGSQDSILLLTVDIQLRHKDKNLSTTPRSTVSAFTQEVPKAAEEEYLKGAKVLEKNPEQGVRHLERAIDLFPTYYLALVRLGSEHVRAGKYEMAVSPLQRAIAVNPKSSLGHITLGMALFELGKFTEAISSLNTGKVLNAQSINAHLYLGIAQLENDQLSDAEVNLRRAYELGGAANAAVVHLHLASLYDRQGKHERAADELEGYLRDVPKAKNAATLRLVIERLRKKAKNQK